MICYSTLYWLCKQSVIICVFNTRVDTTSQVHSTLYNYYVTILSVTISVAYSTGRPVPGYLLATSSAIVLNSFTHSPQHQYQTSTKKSPSPSSSLPRPKSGSLTSSSSPSWSGSQRHQSLVSEATSVDSRYSGRLYPDDATYGKGGLLGLTDCMSSKQSRWRMFWIGSIFDSSIARICNNFNPLFYSTKLTVDIPSTQSILQYITISTQQLYVTVNNFSSDDD